MPELILHHYDISSFSEKIRLIFGLKGLAWRSVIIPATLPKPHYTALTGGYRHTPSLQIGADVYCDTRLITDELEHRYPHPTLFPNGQVGLCRALETWAEGDFFWHCARAVVGANAASLPEEFHADRAAMRGKHPPSLVRTQQAGRDAATQLRAVAAEVNNLVSHTSPFLLGAAPSLADLALYHGLWFLNQFEHRLRHEFFPSATLHTWMQHIAALGHGTRMEMIDTEALAEARAASPHTVEEKTDAPALPVGCNIVVEPVAKTSPAVSGKLVFCDATRVTLKRSHALTGEVHVHFPQLGYRITRAATA